MISSANMAASAPMGSALNRQSHKKKYSRTDVWLQTTPEAWRETRRCFFALSRHASFEQDTVYGERRSDVWVLHAVVPRLPSMPAQPPNHLHRSIRESPSCRQLLHEAQRRRHFPLPHPSPKSTSTTRRLLWTPVSKPASCSSPKRCTVVKGGRVQLGILADMMACRRAYYEIINPNTGLD